MHTIPSVKKRRRERSFLNGKSEGTLVENEVRFVFDSGASQLTAHAFASGLVAVVAHNPKFAVRDFCGEAIFRSDSLAPATIRMNIKASSLDLLDETSEYDDREIRRMTMDDVLEVKPFRTLCLKTRK
jgi:hypothetical protein